MTRYDAIVVGARCAGSATAMLLARKGHRVLLVDRAHFPSDTVSTHLIHAPGAAALKRWGLLDQLAATGCPAITTYSFDFGPIVLRGTPPPSDGTGAALCPRRTVLDKLLLDAAAAAGAEIREGYPVHDLLIEDDRVVGIRGGGAASRSTLRADIVVGADGAHSRVARLAGAPSYRDAPMLSVGYYAYWSGFPVRDAGWAVRPGRGYGAFPTHDGLTMVLAAWPAAELASVRQDVQGNYLQAVRGAYGERLADARREERVVGSGVANHFRKPYGPGWALVGDAGFLLDPVTAQGITDAFLDAELCADAIHAHATGSRRYDEAMADYQCCRDARVSPMYDFTAQLASLEPPPPRFQQFVAAIADQQEGMDAFAGVFAGTVPPSALFGNPPGPPETT